jgi:chemotaxis protein MotB
MRSTSTLLVLLPVVSLLGCVSQADYDHLSFQNRALAQEKELYAQRAANAEAQADNLRGHLSSKESELSATASRADSLGKENDRLGEVVANAHALMQQMDYGADVVMINSPLPPELDKALQNFASAHSDSVEYDEKRGTLKWRSDLLFDSGKDLIKEDAKSTLRTFASVVNTSNASGFDIIVVGHTDSDPIRHAKNRGHNTNWHLSSHRAISVANELIGAQVSPSRLGVMGYGEFRPIASNDSKSSKSLNRRVEIIIVGRAGSNDTENAQAVPETPNK